MTEPATALADVAASVGASRADRAVDGALRAFQAGTPPAEILGAAARGSALHYDPTLRRPPMGLVALAAAANLRTVLEKRLHPLPLLQAVALAASEKKAAQPARPPVLVSGEITHLGRSFLVAARDGDLPEAEAVFLGIVDERAERRMAGDILFRAAAEDLGHGGLKLVVAVKLWQLARALRFREARTILRPAVQFLVAGDRDASAYRDVVAVLGKEWVDLEGLARGGRPLDDVGREGAVAALCSPDVPACTEATLALLRDGYAATSIADAFAVEAARRVVVARGDGREAVHAFLVAHAARFVLTFTRSPETLYALFQAAARIRSPRPPVGVPAPAAASSEGDELRHLARDLEARNPDAAASRTSSYVTRGLPVARLLGVLVDFACRDSAVATEGLNLVLADACMAEAVATKAAEPAMALARRIACSSADWAAYRSWEPLLAP
ncbi:MAG: hypothetical protein ACT4OI_07495 [Methanobacteriota archaeon]